jgi:hypothetical protein
MDTSFEEVWAELNAIYAERSEQRPFFGSELTESDIVRWCGYLGKSRADLYDQIALRVARGFHENELDFTLCDAIVNHVHQVIISSDESRPVLFWRVFGAFDEGEYYHDNNRDEDPEEVYTRPQIARFVEDLHGQ